MLSSTGRGVRDEVGTRPVRRIQDRQAEIGRTSLARSQAGLDRADKSDQTALGDPFALDSGSGLTPELSRTAARRGGVVHVTAQAEPRSGLGLNELLELSLVLLSRLRTHANLVLQEVGRLQRLLHHQVGRRTGSRQVSSRLD